MKKVNELIYYFIVIPIVIIIIMIPIYLFGFRVIIAIIKIFLPLFLIGFILLLIPQLIRKIRFNKEFNLFQTKSSFNLNEYIKLGCAAFNAHDFKRAFFIFEDIIDRYPERPSGYFCMGLLELEKEDIDKAKSYFEKTIAVDKNHEAAKKQLDLIEIRIKSKERERTGSALDGLLPK